MSEVNICRLCLQVVGKDVAFSKVRENESVVQQLKAVSFSTLENLDLTEAPLICESCENELNSLVAFKDLLTTNELTIEEHNEKNDLAAFLKTLNDNIKNICRLCLKTTITNIKLEKNLQERDNVFSQCKITLLEHLDLPLYICTDCYEKIQSTTDFIVSCSNNEKLITDLASTHGILTSRDLHTISLTKNITVKNNSKKTGKIINKKSKPLAKKKKRINAQKSSVTSESADNSSTKNPEEIIVKNPVEKPNATQPNPVEKAQDDCLSMKRKIYTNRKSKENSSRDGLGTSWAGDIQLMFKKMSDELKNAHTSIDTVPVENITDITLNVNEEGDIETSAIENNATQELIDVLEGRLREDENDYATQLLINVLEGESDEEASTSQPKTVELGNKSSANTKPDDKVKLVDVGKKQGHKQTQKIKSAHQKTIADANKEASENNNNKKQTKSLVEDQRKVAKRKIKGTEKTEPISKKPKKSSQIPDTVSADAELTTEQPANLLAGPVVGSDDEDDEFSEGGSLNLDKRPLQVTIIKGKKRKNKAELDKTWQELTGKPVASTSTTSSSSNKPQPAEITVVKPPPKRRGRPPSKKPVEKAAKETAWMRCEKCPFKTYTHNSFIQHQIIHSVMSTVPALFCDVCPFNTTNAELMEQHKTTHASGNLTYKCVFCDSIFKKKNSCMFHTLRHDDRDVASQFYCLVYNSAADEEHYECYQCDYQNLEESPMPDHVISHTIEKPKNPLVAKFKCDQCLYRTKSEETLKRHKLLHEEKNKKRKKILMPQLKTETGEVAKELDELPILSCTKCHYVTRNKRSLSNHIGLKHNRSLTPIEAAEAAAARNLAEGSPMYYCNECSYSTYRKLNMPRHMLVHKTKETMILLECPHCIFETKHRRSYTRHMEVVHGVIL